MKVPHPLAVVIARPPAMGRLATEDTDHLSARVMVPVRAESPPMPVQYSRYYGIGRAPNDIEPHRHVVVETDIPGVLSHVHFSNDGGFLAGRPMVSIRNAGNYADALAIPERVNIETPTRTQSPGSAVELRGQFQYAPEYRKLI